MGWAGPAQPTRPDSAQKVLGRFRPKMDWADLGPKWIGPISAQKTNIPLLGQDPPGPATKTGGGIIFPHPCMQNAIRSACRERKK
jgi:hypothetical protein